MTLEESMTMIVPNYPEESVNKIWLSCFKIFILMTLLKSVPVKIPEIYDQKIWVPFGCNAPILVSELLLFIQYIFESIKATLHGLIKF